jgi:SAM-dependent methyltransferase
VENNKGYSKEWEGVYVRGEQNSVWPWSDLVSLIHRHCKQIIKLSSARVLELGCGPGANIPFFLSLGMNYHAIEGSQTIIQKLQESYPELKQQIIKGDFTTEQSFSTFMFFDLVVDRGALTYNSKDGIKSALHLVLNALNPGGYFIGVDWISINHSDANLGLVCGDEYTRTEIPIGQFFRVGKVHFSDETHLRELFSGFKIVLLEEKIYKNHEPFDGHQLASWNIVARKL